MENTMNWAIAWTLIGNLISIIVLTRVNQVHKKSESTLNELRELKAFTQGTRK